MQVVQIVYENKNKERYTANILAEKKEKAVTFLNKVVKGVTKIESLKTNKDVIHGVDDEVIDRILNSNPKVKKYKEKINKYEDMMKSYEEEISYLKEQVDKSKQRVSSKELAESMKKAKKVFACPICKKDFDSLRGFKIHVKSAHKDLQKEIEQIV